MVDVKKVKLAKKGNAQAFQELIEQEKVKLYKMAYIYMKNEHDALEVFQETVYKTLVSIKSLKEEKYFSTWVTKILMDQGEVGKIIIKEIEVNEDKTYVYFEVVSDFPYDGHLKHNGIDLETSSGKKLVSTEKPYAERVKGNLYMQEFETSKEDLVITTFKYPQPVMLESIDIQIP